jgi:DNA-directed RNA polymerase subunit RPC12/RpoP
MVMKPSGKGNMPRVAYLGVTCGRVVEFPQHVGPEKYDGGVRCQECSSLMHIKLEGSKVVEYSLKKR